MWKKFFLPLLLTLNCLTPELAAQTERTDLYSEAEKAYEMGRFEYVDSLLSGHFSELKTDHVVPAYRLMVLSNLYLDNTERARKYAEELLSVDSFYTPYGDSPRFADLIEKLKQGRGTTITTASQQTETVEDAPVPVTVITEKMIENCNARTVVELLNLYVPGVSILEGEEANFSMRGMSGYSQEEVLFLLNGVRLNSYNTHSLAPDYRISIHNIKQIEVLRGSASSLYGNVALSAVVNIITKSGADLNGLELSVGGGYQPVADASVQLGRRIADTDVIAWASVHWSKGYRHDISGRDTSDGYGFFVQDGSIFVNGYSKMPAYDVGMNFNWNHLSVLFSHNYGKRSYAYTNLFVPSLFSAEKYGTVFGVSPGRGVASTNLNFRYSNKWGRWNFEGNLYGNHENTTMFNVFGDKIPAPESFWMGFTWLEPGDIPEGYNADTGVFHMQGWKDFNIGINLKAIVDYTFLGRGNVLFGFQNDFFCNYFHNMALGESFTHVIVSKSNGRSPLFGNSVESTYSGFAQLKHYFTPRLILNGGLRYDHRIRYNQTERFVLSPRVAIIWNPTVNQNYKLSYGRSFVDAPYFYRTTRNIYYGNEDLKPQFLNNVQLSATIRIPSVHLTYEGNIFYNNVKDIITLGEIEYENSGVVRAGGWENILTYSHKGWTASAMLYLQKLFKSQYLKVEGNCIFSVPNISARFNLSKEVVRGLTLDVQMYLNGKTRCVLPFYVFVAGELSEEKYRDYPPCFLMDAGIRYRWSFLEFNVRAKNITNRKYRLGGDRVPVLQEGFTIWGGVTFHISK